MRRIAAVLVAGALAAAVLVASATPAVRGRPRVSVIGDSIITAVSSTPPAKTLLGRNVDLRFLAVTCRRLVQPSCWYNGMRPPTAMDVIRASGGTLGETVVVESGYNEYVQVYASDIDTVMQAFVDAGVETVLWLTLREQRPDYEAMNAQIRGAADRWPELVVVDWNAASRDRAWFNDDGLHLNEQGALGMARLLRKFVVEYVCGGSCARLPRPTA
jgi:hypothetical protein